MNEAEASRYLPNYTLADYEQWEGDWELWDGHPVAMVPSPGFGHQRVAGRLFVALNQLLDKQGGCHCETLYEIDWRVSDNTVVRPDLLVVCEPIETKWVEVTPTLIAEVLSPSTSQNDLTYKRRLYAREGVKYYLIVDPEAKTVEALALQGDTYAAIRSDDAVLSFELHDGCAVSLAVAGLWA
ncbi:Uma2 family endonuclease [Phycisphaeraceae bacterium D3-23]